MRGVEAEAVIEWVDHHLAVILTSTQKDLIRIYVGENAARPWAPNSYAQGGHRFAELLVAEYCEEMDHSAREKGTGIRTMRHCESAEDLKELRSGIEDLISDLKGLL